ncbi:UdgX family uracil-DNA binding protein [Marmoricola sp. URHB0036]|uniref:UdgX family uracil-DNA binding protein n=1 Tax=Marmoricola sp. URHB0036 TaxID=1298863 RepID=UPI0003FD6F9D|nr:UdgX family uracil-DNA binding protein [Marmoricola sp. URHB0036]
MAGKQAPGAQRWVPDRVTPQRLRAGVDQCRGCELYENATHGVPGRGPRDAPLMVVGEQPGDQEDKAGEAFVGPAGKLLDRALAAAGIDPESVYRTNAVKHFRWERGRRGNRLHKGPTRTHVAACGPWLVAELDMVQPQGVVLLGATAAQSVYGSDFRITESRGVRLDWPDEIRGSSVVQPPDWALATMHPSAVLRSRQREDDLARLVEDLERAAGLLIP